MNGKDRDQSDEKEVIYLNNIRLDLPNINVPNPPSNLVYDKHQDYYYEQLLLINEVDVSEQSLVQVVKEKTDMYLKAAAAHTIGSKGYQGLTPVLEAYFSFNEDIQGVEIAFAMFRLGASSQAERRLRVFLNNDLRSHYTPLVAAGYLAKMGIPVGYKIILEVFQNDAHKALRTLACKQLFFLVPFHSMQTNVWKLFEMALLDSNLDVQWQALVQLKYLPISEQMRQMLGQYILRSTDRALVETAKAILIQKD